MPVSVVVGGQYGSEGKGKIALEIVRREPNVGVAVRVGGPNSGHTGVSLAGRKFVLRQIPVAAIDGSVLVVLPAGSYIDVEVLLSEIEMLGLRREQVVVSRFANVISPQEKAWEQSANLPTSIGSTGSGTGAAVMARAARSALNFPLKAVNAKDVAELRSFLRRDTTAILRDRLDGGERVVVEGTQGFGLSLLHGDTWPKATSRDTTAATFVAEAGLSPLDVDDVTLVLRCHPIRVAGDSGPLPNEISWKTVAEEAGLPDTLEEFTTVTHRVRRVGRFDAAIVRRAIAVNRPTRVVLNHLDYVDPAVQAGRPSSKAQTFVSQVEASIDRKIDWLGIDPARVMENRVHSEHRLAASPAVV